MKVRFETTEAVYEWINTRLPEGMVWRKGWVPQTGITVTDDRGRELLCAVIYHDMSVDVAYVGWIASNPANTAKETEEALKAVIGNLDDYCRMYGVEHLIAASGHKGIQKKFERAGFGCGDETVRHYYRWMGGPGNRLKRN